LTFSLLDALDDDNLFAPFFASGTWDRWRVFLKALFALPLSNDDMAIYSKHTGRTDPPVRPYNEAALVVGRRGGKSRCLALVAVFLATFKSYDECLAPGEVATVAILASNRAQARSIY
jgi:hypothetical protein